MTFIESFNSYPKEFGVPQSPTMGNWKDEPDDFFMNHDVKIPIAGTMEGSRGIERVWVTPVRFDEIDGIRMCIGKLKSEPISNCEFRKGDEVPFPKEFVEDVYQRPNIEPGGFVVWLGEK